MGASVVTLALLAATAPPAPGAAAPPSGCPPVLGEGAAVVVWMGMRAVTALTLARGCLRGEE
ncbi:MAG: hypothetical protein KJ058_02020 [Thermoanaerobaculia bacterium]|nr:hypothetical protein [Thermoanaerobaculia bacterium]MCZ7652269.1 hypothetical protein [Thermoanaerobaculia bacterium]